MNSRLVSVHIQRGADRIIFPQVKDVLGADALILGRCLPLGCELLECSVAGIKLYIPLSKVRSFSFWISFWNFAESLLKLGKPIIGIRRWTDLSAGNIYIIESALPIGVLLCEIQQTSKAMTAQYDFESLPFTKMILVNQPESFTASRINQAIISCGLAQRHFIIRALELQAEKQDFWRGNMKMEIIIGSIDLSLEELLTLRPGDMIAISEKNVSIPCYLSCGDRVAFGGQLAISTPLKIHIESLILPQLSKLSSEAKRDFISEEKKDDGE